jgi:hypothetical protein
METIITKYTNDLHTIATHLYSGSEILTDAPLDNNGKAEFFSPRRIAEIMIELDFPANNYTTKEKAYIEGAARACPVAKSLHPDLKQTIIFHYH